jgi:hypothetical protein
MPKSNTLRILPDGSVYLKDRQQVEHLLNPKRLSSTTTASGSHRDATVSSLFKLVTVKELKATSSADRREQLRLSRERLAQIAVSTNNPPPYPEELPENIDNLNVYGVYVDEDLYPGDSPIYTFTSGSAHVKAFINATGADKESWTVHLAYQTARYLDGAGVPHYEWHCLSIDGEGETFFLSNTNLPDAFTTVSLDYLNYTGGGCWSCLAVDPNDRITILGMSNDPVKYKPVGMAFRYMGISSALSIVDYSFTPTYHLYWNRGTQELSYRTREATRTLDTATLVDSGVLKQKHVYSYTLDCHRSADDIHIETLQGEVVYVGNTNAPEIASNVINPDYGTDVARLSVEQYKQTSNIIRPKAVRDTLNPLPSRISVTNMNTLGVLARNHEGTAYLYIDTGIQEGHIQHGYDVKSERASRGFDYGDFYQLRWVPGKIITFRPTNKGEIYRVSKSTGAYIPTGETLFDRGSLLISPDYANAMLTTWTALPNPQTGFFGILTGELTWETTFLNPPIFGHEGVYYYEINPDREDSVDTPRQSDLGDAVNQKNTLLNIFAQMQGGLGGTTTVDSYFLGYRPKASGATDTVVVRDPTPDQKARQRTQSELFPNGYWPTDFFSTEVDNANNIKVTNYNRQGQVTSTNTSGPSIQPSTTTS